ncbi:MAG: hypothetical protein FJ088_11195 [Deltaproteobacteria bacterium]|nr:hypothetical protein [Deltaproteobacteria bacterium]
MDFFRKITGCLLLIFVHASCSDTEILSGIWESGKVDLSPVYGSGAQGHIQLVIGHFGPQVSGIIKFFPEDSPVKDFCACRYLCDAEFSSDKLEFKIPSPAPPCAPCDPQSCNSCDSGEIEKIKAVFKYDHATDTLTEGSLMTVPAINFDSLERKTPKEDITPDDRKCDNY